MWKKFSELNTHNLLDDIVFNTMQVIIGQLKWHQWKYIREMKEKYYIRTIDSTTKGIKNARLC